MNDPFLPEAVLRAGEPATDEEITRRVLAGEVELFELLMRRHNQLVYRSVRPILRDETEVEDAMQQAYVSAFTNLAGFLGRSSFRTWLVRIAVHEALARLRRARRHRSLDGDDGSFPALAAAAPDAPPPDVAANGELARLLQQAIDALPALYRRVFVLRAVEGLDTATTAEALGTSEDVVKTRLSRARSMLHRRLAAVAVQELGAVFPFPATRCDRIVRGVLRRILAGFEAAQ